jgi:hypothetical protein
MSISEKPPMDDSTSETLKSATPSVNEKVREAEGREDSVREGSQTPNAEAVNNEDGLGKVHSATKQAQDELTRVMTSGEGIEYPTGVKLGLISLALCLSVFLMALVCAALLPQVTSIMQKVLTLICKRITPSLRLRSRKSPISSTLCQTLAGMVLRIYSPPPPSNSFSGNFTHSSPSNTSTSRQSAYLSLVV